MNPLSYLLLINLLFSCGLMTVVWALSIRINNYSIVDIAWAFAFGLMGILDFTQSSGPSATLFLVMLGVWSLRLGLFLFSRIQRHYPSEDNRYVQLRKEYGSHVRKRFFIFFQLQALSLVFLSLPLIIVTRYASTEISTIQWIAFGVWTMGILGETLADWQASRFKTRPENKDKICQIGLWNYSRHPNYFFESVIWWSYFLYACAFPWGWVSILCPLTILFLLLKVTGIPLAEAQAIKNRGSAYLDYQKSTSRFIPWFKGS